MQLSKKWTRFLGRVDFGNPFTIAQYPTGTNQAGEKTGNVNVENLRQQSILLDEYNTQFYAD